eukprot:g31607.t1
MGLRGQRQWEFDGSFVWREIGALSPKVSPIQGNKKKPGTKKGAKKSASKKQGTKKGGNQHHRPGCNFGTCPRMRANQEKNDGDNEESPHQSPHQSPPKTPPFRVGGGDRTPPKGNGGRKEPEEEKVNRKHVAGCQCQECVPLQSMARAACAPPVIRLMGKVVCVSGGSASRQRRPQVFKPPAARQTAASVVIRMAIMAPPLNAYFMARAACAPTVILMGGAGPKAAVSHGSGCQCFVCAPQQQRNGNSGVGGQQNDNHWHGGGGGGGNGGGGRNNGGGYGGQQLSAIWQPSNHQGANHANSLSAYLAHSQQQTSAYLAQSQQQGSSFINYIASRVD